MTDTPDAGGMGTVSASGVRYLPDGHRVFEPRNVASVTHGGYSARLVGPIADDIADELTDIVADTPAAAPSFAAARSALALKLARLRRVVTWIEERHGGMPLDADGEVLAAARLELDLLASIEKSLDQLGLTPSSAARLGVDLLRGGSLATELQDALDARDRADRRMLTINEQESQ